LQSQMVIVTVFRLPDLVGRQKQDHALQIGLEWPPKTAKFHHPSVPWFEPLMRQRIPPDAIAGVVNISLKRAQWVVRVQLIPAAISWPQWSTKALYQSPLHHLMFNDQPQIL